VLSQNDIVYVLREGENPELKYSLRSVEKNFPHRKVVFVGGKPDGLEPDLYIPAEQTQDKWHNSQDLILKACLDDRLSENIILFNDDFFVLKPIKALPVYVNRTLPELARLVTHNGKRESEYITKRINPCIEKLKARGLPLVNYELHLPMEINRAKMAKIYSINPLPEAKRSFYGNLYRIRGQEIDPYKMNDGSVQSLNGEYKVGRTFISTTDESWQGRVGEQIRELFPTPSQYELKKSK